MEPALVRLIKANIDISVNIDLWVQIFILVVLVIYTIFTFLVYKQVGILNRTISTPRAKLIHKIAQIHLASSLVLLAVTVIVLLL